MSYFVSLTYDLKGADSSSYKKIEESLAEIDFSKTAISRKKKGKETTLPRNIFVSGFDEDEFEDSTSLREWVRERIEDIFSKNNVKGKVFIAVGKDWSWSNFKV